MRSTVRRRCGRHRQRRHFRSKIRLLHGRWTCIQGRHPEARDCVLRIPATSEV